MPGAENTGAENGTAENGVFSPSKILNDLGENTKKFGKEADQNIQNALKNTGNSMRNLFSATGDGVQNLVKETEKATGKFLEAVASPPAKDHPVIEQQRLESGSAIMKSAEAARKKRASASAPEAKELVAPHSPERSGEEMLVMTPKKARGKTAPDKPTAGLGIFGLAGLFVYCAVLVPLVGVLLSDDETSSWQALVDVCAKLESTTGAPAVMALEQAWLHVETLPKVVQELAQGTQMLFLDTN